MLWFRGARAVGTSVLAVGATTYTWSKSSQPRDRVFLDQSYVDAFSRDGFVVVPDLLTPSDMHVIRSAVLGEVRAGLDGGALEDKTAFQRVFEKYYNLWEESEAVHPVPFNPKIAGAAHQLLGGDTPVRVWHDSALVKMAGGSKTPAHQDHPYWPIHESEHHAVTAWIPLAHNGSTLASGAVGYIPGSHRSEVFSKQDIFVDDEEAVNKMEATFLADERLQGKSFQYVEVPPGGVAFHHSRTIHAALPNRTNDDRPAYCIIYFKDGCTRKDPNNYHASTDREGGVIEPGQVIDSEVTPIAFPIVQIPCQPTLLVPEAELRHLKKGN